MPITLTNPLSIGEPAVIVQDKSFEVLTDRIIVKLTYESASGKEVHHEIIEIFGPDFDQLMNATVQAGQVGQKFMAIVRKAIQNKAKAVLQVEGTES